MTQPNASTHDSDSNGSGVAPPDKLSELVELLGMMPDRSDRIQMLIDISRRFQEVPPEVARRPFPEDHLVPGCESQAYLWALPRPDDTLKFHFAVENPQGISAMAMAVILDESLSGQPLERVAAVPQDIVYDVFGRELSMGKSMGLMGMVGMVINTAKKAMAASGS